MRWLWILLMVPWLVAATPNSGSAEGVAGVAFRTLEGRELALGDLAGRPLLIVNTASRCGFTPQYAALQTLWERYRDHGLVVIGVPSNDFRQELATSDAIKEFCEVNFGIDFPMTEAVRIRGVDQHPFFAVVTDDLGANALPRWNFHKYLVGRDGQVRASWPSSVVPTGPTITAAIEAALAEAVPGS
ncbi:MAG: glutathione peroxidase [Pseudomonadota bacterium]